MKRREKSFSIGRGIRTIKEKRRENRSKDARKKRKQGIIKTEIAHIYIWREREREGG